MTATAPMSGPCGLILNELAVNALKQIGAELESLEEGGTEFALRFAGRQVMGPAAKG